jgi:hypothetical protein
MDVWFKQHVEQDRNIVRYKNSYEVFMHNLDKIRQVVNY